MSKEETPKEFTIDFERTPMRVRVYLSDMKGYAPRITLAINGLMNPLSTIEIPVYMGEETKNPQLKPATDEITRIFNDWTHALSNHKVSLMASFARATFLLNKMTSHRQKLGTKFKISPIENLSIDTKEGSITGQDTNIFFWGGGPSYMQAIRAEARNLAALIEQARPAIQQAIDTGKSIPLTDPTLAILEATHRAYQSINNGSPTLHPGSAEQHTNGQIFEEQITRIEQKQKRRKPKGDAPPTNGM